MSTALLFAAFASAAPVPAELLADRPRLEQLWNELAADDLIVQVRAALALADHPRAVEFLAKKCLPVKASAEKIREWLADLGSDDEKVWKPAFEPLRYFDPRIEFTLGEVIGMAGTDAARLRIIGLWDDLLARLVRSVHSVQLTLGQQTPTGTTVWVEWATEDARPGPLLRSKFTVPPLDGSARSVWKQSSLAVVVLNHLNTTTSRAALDRIADGHPDALPTRTAVAAQGARFAAHWLPSQFDRDWPRLLEGDPVASVRWALDLRNHPDRVSRLAAKLPPIKASEEQVTKWIKALESDDAKMWQPAFESLLYFHPSLALSPETQCELVAKDPKPNWTTEGGWESGWNQPRRVAPPVRNDPARSCLYAIWGGATSADEVSVYLNCSLYTDGDRLWLNQSVGCGVRTLTTRIQSLEALNPPHWQRARLAIIALERTGTADSKAVLRQLADGHPDILPTKEAKAVLERLNYPRIPFTTSPWTLVSRRWMPLW